VSELALALLDQLDESALVLLAERLAPHLQRILDARPTGSGDGWFNTAQAADYLGCSPDRLHDLVARRALSHGRDGRRLLFKRADLDRYVEGPARL
jgi:excisionase family DNA binding protein